MIKILNLLWQLCPLYIGGKSCKLSDKCKVLKLIVIKNWHNKCVWELKKAPDKLQVKPQCKSSLKAWHRIYNSCSDLCAGILCLNCCLKGWEAVGPIRNTWRCRGLLVYFIPDCWCTHNHGLEHPLELYGFTCTD